MAVPCSKIMNVGAERNSGLRFSTATLLLKLKSILPIATFLPVRNPLQRKPPLSGWIGLYVKTDPQWLCRIYLTRHDGNSQNARPGIRPYRHTTTHSSKWEIIIT